MKKILKSILLTAVLAMVVAGCQKDANDLNVSLKSAASDCAEFSDAHGTGCTYSFKIEPWDEFATGEPPAFSQNKTWTTPEGYEIRIYLADDNSFCWESDAPVCAVIIKAGNKGEHDGLYLVAGQSGYSGCIDDYEYGIEKAISHVTFCYGAPPKIIALKIGYSDGIYSGGLYGISSGTNVFGGNSEWCGTWLLGTNPYPSTSTINLNRAGFLDPLTPDGSIGSLLIDGNGDATITLKAGLTLTWSALFVGTESQLKAYLWWKDQCPIYTAFPWIYKDSGDIYHFDLPPLPPV